MKLSAKPTESALGVLWSEAVELLHLRRYEDLAHRVGYALSYERDPASAIRQDLEKSIQAAAATSLSPNEGNRRVNVVFFKPNDSGLIAAADGVVPTDNGKSVNVSLVVTLDSEDTFHVTLEDINFAA